MKKELTLKDLMKRKPDDEDAPAFDLGPLKDILKPEEMPPLDHKDEGHRQASRMRIVRALHAKYGPNWRIRPELKDAIDHYDKEVRFHKIYKQTLGARHG